MAIERKLVEDNAANIGARRSLAAGDGMLADLLEETGRPAEAEAEFRKALAIAQKLVDDVPGLDLLWRHC